MNTLLVRFCAAVFFLMSSPGAAKPATVSEWRSDIDQVVNDLRLHHHDPFKITGKLAFLRAAKALKDDLPDLTEEQRMVRLMQLVALIGDAHTSLSPDRPDFAWWYPIRFMEFEDGYFVTSAHASVKELAGAEVLEVAGRPVHEIAEAARSLMGTENRFDRKQKLYAIHNAMLMKGLGFAGENGEITARLRLPSGEVVERTLTPQRGISPRFGENYSGFEWQWTGEMYGLPFGSDDEWFSAYQSLPASAFREIDLSRPAHLTRRVDFVARPMPEQNAYYLQFNFLNDTTFLPFLRDAMAEIDEMRPEKLIIDFRFNFGGDASKGTEAIHEFIKRQDNPPWQEIYFLTGPKTFSAAVLMMYLFYEHVPLTSVGEPAGGPFNMSGDPLEWRYPATGLHMYISTLYYQKAAFDDVSEFVKVDYPAPFTFADYAAGRDTALDLILNEKDIRSIPVIALDKGSAAAREAYLRQKAEFANLDWWLPPTEFELRQVCDKLWAAEQKEDALDACRLTTEIHPGIWNSWYNLAFVQRRIEGLEEKGLESYRCVMEMEPNNWNVPAIKNLFERLGADPALPEGCPVGK